MGKGLILVAAAIGFSVGNASADFISETGEFAYGPRQDVIKNTVVCKSSKDMFQILDVLLSRAGDKALMEKGAAMLSTKRCIEVPASTVWLTHIKVGRFKIKGEDIFFPVGKVAVEYVEYYAAPDALINSGVEMGEIAQQLIRMNKNIAK